jgi:hypothetical protein
MRVGFLAGGAGIVLGILALMPLPQMVPALSPSSRLAARCS